mmetsp:Transcript_23642/g.53143  ORF Transcript_23642/g.53143 Transcript_23642/m.53143 type:complete len:163 (+) Transcript_23642:610-1098(+)
MPFSEYLLRQDNMERGRDYMQLFGEWTAVFGKDALKIVDYYGAIAAGKSVPHVVLCEAAGVLCMSPKGDATNNKGADLEMQQVFTDFSHFVDMQQSHCSSLCPQHPSPKQTIFGRFWGYFYSPAPTDLVGFFSKMYKGGHKTHSEYSIGGGLIQIIVYKEWV